MQRWTLDRHELRLQSLRGLAALSVAVGHCFTIMSNGRLNPATYQFRGSNLVLTVGEVLIQPNTAVILFYVLSGLVLAESLRMRAGAPIWRWVLSFGIRRLARMLPVMWVSLFAAAVVLLTFGGMTYLGTTAGWFSPMFAAPLDLWILFLNLIGWQSSLNGVLWSVLIELRVIPLMPIVVLILARTSLWADAVIFALLVAVSLLLWERVPTVFMYFYCFYLGAMIPKIISSEIGVALLKRRGVVIAALLLLIPIQFGYSTNRLWLPYKFMGDTVISAVIIGFVLLRPERTRWLLARPLVRLGDISYSFYAYALLTLMVTAAVLLRLFPAAVSYSDLEATVLTLAITVISVAAAWVLSEFSYRYVELPGIALGRRLSGIFERRGAKPAGMASPTGIEPVSSP